MIAFEIPGRPVAHARSRSKAGQAPYLPKKQASYGNLVKTIAAERMLVAGLAPLEGAVSVTLRAEYVRPKSHNAKQRECRWKTSKPDADNLLKIVADGMNGIVYVDDAQVVEVAVQKLYGLRERLVIEVSPA